MPGQHLVDDRTQCIQIGATVDRLGPRLLRTHVVRCSDRGAGHRGTRLSIHRLGDAEVRQHGGAVGLEQDVAGLDVAMHEALGVGEIEPARDVAGDVERLGDRQSGLDTLAQRATGNELRGEVVHRAVRADVEHRHQVRMTELGRDPAFLEEAVGELGVRGQRRRHHLERDFAIERFLHGEEHRRHAAFSDRPQDAVAGNGDIDRAQQDGGSHGRSMSECRRRLCPQPIALPRALPRGPVPGAASQDRNERTHGGRERPRTGDGETIDRRSARTARGRLRGTDRRHAGASGRPAAAVARPRHFRNVATAPPQPAARRSSRSEATNAPMS
jgi:hypothetical protein